MTGLESIVFEIEASSREKAAELEQKARNEAKQIVNEAVLEAEKISDIFKEEARSKSELLISRAKTADAIKLKREILAKKQAIIKEVTLNAKSSIKNQTSEAYSAFLLKLLDRYAQPEKGTLLMSKTDMDLISADFKTEAKRRGLEIKAGSIAQRDGFVLAYGNIEINCTVDKLFDTFSENISDMLNGLLFGSEGGV